MKKLTLFLALFISLTALKAQQTCITAVNIVPTATCNYSTHTTTGTDYWLKFSATSPTVNISLVTVKFDLNATHIHNLALYSGSCSNPVLVADDELPFVEDAKELAIDLNASGLIVGQSYFLKATRLATNTVCDKGTCTANGSTDPTVFDICVQDINVIIPLDFGLELPALDHSYITNRGQLIDVNGNPIPDVKLYSDQSTPAVYIAEDKIYYVFGRINSDTTDTLHRVDATLVGSNSTKIFKTERIGGITNYFKGHIPAGVTGNKSYSRAVCNDVYQDIDMQYYSNTKGLKFYFIVKPGGNPNDIIIQYDGASIINVTPSGGLEIVTTIGTLDFEPPHAYRVNSAGNVVPMPWQCKFEAIPNTTNQVKFKVHNYDPIMPLIIQVDRGHDNQLQSSLTGIEWSTFKGGTHNEEFRDIQFGNGGDKYVTGYSQSTDFPVTPGAVQQFNNGTTDAVVIHFNNVDNVVWSTYYGGSSIEFSNAIEFGNDGVYFAGETRSTNFPTLQKAGSYNQSVHGGGFLDGFIVKLSLTDGLPIWATYVGGTGDDAIRDLSYNGTGDTYFVGFGGNNIPLVLGGVGSFNSNSYSGSYGSYIGKLDGQDQIVWATLFGSGFARSVSASSTNVFVTGQSVIDDLPYKVGVIGSYIDSTMYGTNECFIAKFNNSDSLTWATYYGANFWSGDTTLTNYYGIENGLAIVSKDSIIYVTGSASLSDDFPTQNSGGYYDNTLYPTGNGDLFILKFDWNGIRQWATLYGGDSGEEGYAIAIDSKDNVYFTGEVASSGTTFGTQQVANAYYDNALGSTTDAFILSFDKNDNRLWSTFYGGLSGGGNNGEDRGYGLAINSSDKLYIIGRSSSYVDFPLENDLIAYYDGGLNNGASTVNRYDGFISRLDLNGIVSSVEDINYNGLDNNFLIYPNPNNGLFNVVFQLENKEDVTLQVFDLTGRLVYITSKNNLVGKQKLELDIRNSAKGIYFVTLQVGNERWHKKVIKN